MRLRVMSRNSARLGTAGGHRDLTAQSVLALEQGDPVTAFGGGHRRLEPAGAPTGHHHPAVAPGPGDGDRLAPGPRVLDATEPSVESHPPDAFLVARETGADIGGMTGTGFGGEVGIGDLAPHHADQIADAVVEGALGLLGVLEPAHPHHREIDGLADGARDEEGITGRDLHAGLDHEEGGGGHAYRGVDVVDLAGGFDHTGHGHRVFDVGASLDELVAAQPDPEDLVGPDGVPYGIDDLEQKAGPLDQWSAVGVIPGVGGGREEAAHDRGVRALELDAVEPTLHAVAGHQGVPVDDLGDLPELDGLRDLAEQGIGDRARSPHRQAGVHAGRLTAVVVDLGQDGHVVGVDPIGDASVPVDDLGSEPVDELLVRPVGGVGRVLLGDDQPAPPAARAS